MDWKKLALGGVVLGALMGCSGGPSVPSFPTPRTHRYVVSVLRIPEPMGSMAYGFNLDGVVSTGEGTTCVDLAPDYQSINDPGENGVDNGLATLVPLLNMAAGGGSLDEGIASQIASGSLLLVMEVSGIDNYTTDSSVMLSLHRGEVAGGMPLLAEDGTLAPGQEFMLTAVSPAVMGSITNGRLRAQTDALPVTIDTGNPDVGAITLTFHNAQIRANISKTGLAVGAIGGAIVIEELVMTAEMVRPGAGDLVRSAVTGDLQPDPANTANCASLSAGLSFTAIDHVDAFDDATP